MELKVMVFLFVSVHCFANGTTSQKEALVMLEEGDAGSLKPENRQSGYEEEVCSPQSVCMPISSCPLLEDLLDKSCLASDKYFRRLTALTCGWRGGEARVCCPPGGDRPASGGSDEARPAGVQADEGAPIPETCGRPMVQARNYVGIGSHPWVVRIGFRNKATGQLHYPCGGSIISKRVVLTAAHCALAKAEGYKLVSVTVGEWDTATDPDCGDMFCASPVQVLPLSHVVVHPGYDSKLYRHDLALLVLKQDIKYTLSSMPVCLAGAGLMMPEGARGVVAGWGRVGLQRQAPSARQALSVPLLPISACARLYSPAAPLSTAQLCAGAEPGRDACAGFGGSPLVVLADGSYTQIGIVSFGSEKCGSAGVPSVYTSVLSYANWIRDNSPPA